jgi:hypothetical protein
MLWSETQFEQAVRLAWIKLAETKPNNYQVKLREVVKLYYGVDRYSTAYDPSFEEEIKINCAYGYDLYQTAHRNALNALVLGPNTIRQREFILFNFGISSVVPYQNAVDTQLKGQPKSNVASSSNSGGDEMEGVEATIPPPAPASVTDGAVLAEANWWPFLNDAWLLGGVHNNATFYLHIPGKRLQLNNKVLWDDAVSRARVLGRELIALSAFGYRRMLVDDPDDRFNKLKAHMSYVFVPSDRQLTQSATFEKLCEAVSAVSSAEEIQILLGDQHGIAYHQYDYGVMGSNVFQATQDIPAFFESMIDSLSYRVVIGKDARLDISPGGKDVYLKVQVSDATISILQTGFPTERMSSWKGILYIHKDLFSQTSQAVVPVRQ